MKGRAGQSISHDHLFHTLLGLLDVRTALYEPDWDITRACRHEVSTREAVDRPTAPSPST
jgi:glucan phosphoethanolaminetransferase (alkaline phosphatase superfamily)